MVKRRIGCLIAGALVMLGIMLVFAGFGYDLLFAGIPPQDPPPDIAASYVFHARVARQIMRAGMMVFVVGVITSVTMGIVALMSKRTR